MEDNRTVLDKIVAPSREEQEKIRTGFKNIAYYLIIGVISIISALVLPLFVGGISGDISLGFPTNTEGWICWSILRVTIAGLNVAIFALFKLQAKVNVSKEESYIKACKEYYKIDEGKSAKPMSPKQKQAKDWSIKGTTVVITSILASATLSSLIINFDLVTFISSIVTVVMAICFGYCTMRKDEIYWTEEFPEYLEMKKKEKEK